MRQDDFVNFMRATICKFEQGNSYGTAHIYKNSLSNLIAFYRTDRIPFKKITPELLKGFEFYLRQKQLSWNTVSTYLRTIRATYNRAVDRHLAPYIPRLFKQVYTVYHIKKDSSTPDSSNDVPPFVRISCRDGHSWHKDK